MFEKVKFSAILFLCLILLVFLLPLQEGFNNLTSSSSSYNYLKISLSLVNPAIKVISADPSNELVLRIDVRNNKGVAVPKAHILLSEKNGLGSFNLSQVYTDKNGQALISYNPPDFNGTDMIFKHPSVTLSAKISKSEISSAITLKLATVPVVFVHGYKANSDVFRNLNQYLVSQGYSCSSMDYTSENGVIDGAKSLGTFLSQQKLKFLSQGIQVKRFDLVSHSMGGLVARYYTCSQDYIMKADVRKLIFLSVPQKGSPWAALGEKVFSDQGVRDLKPDNPLFLKTFPAMLNRGLNSSVQTGSLLGQNDEVVNLDSASLDEWGIKTELFSMGESKIDVKNLLNGSFSDLASNHMSIINNKKVFEKIKSMLSSEMPCPTQKSQ